MTPATAVNIALLPPLDMLPQMRAAKAGGLDRAQISVNAFAVQLESVRRGMGVAVLPRILAKDLIELFPDLQLPDMEVYLVTRPQALKQAHIKCFFCHPGAGAARSPLHGKCRRLPLWGDHEYRKNNDAMRTQD